MGPMRMVPALWCLLVAVNPSHALQSRHMPRIRGADARSAMKTRLRVNAMPPHPTSMRPQVGARCTCMAAAGASLAPDVASREPFMLYNTLTRSKEEFKALRAPKVTFYSCGPTVYDYAHIGNFRAFLMYDILKRWLTYRGYDVDHVCNLTDIDDKIIARIARDGVGLQELTNKYAEAFFDDLSALNITPARAYPRATEHLDDITSMVSQLLRSQHAYAVKDSVYFEVSKSAEYGRLARLDWDGMQDGAGEGGGISDVKGFEGDKRSARDFALWKAYKPEDGDLVFDTTWGRGRPGWHIECSAMVRHFFGDQLDLHAGGIDLVFPHHVNEIAQSEAVTGKQMAQHWVHNGFVNVNDEKMSKSKGNFLTLRGTFQNSLDVRAFRYLVVSSQYRMALNFSPEALAAARKAVKRLDRFRELVGTACESSTCSATGAPQEGVAKVVESAVENFEKAMNDDMNTPRAFASLFALLKGVQPRLQAGTVDRESAQLVWGALERLNGVFGIFYDVPASYWAEGGAEVDAGESREVGVPEAVLRMVEQRMAAKAAKDYAEADRLRAEISAAGFSVMDVKGQEQPVVERLS